MHGSTIDGAAGSRPERPGRFAPASWLPDVAIAAACALLTWAMLRWAAVHGAIAPLWPPAGLALAWLLLRGANRWPLLGLAMLAAYGAVLLGPLPPLAVAAVAAAHVLGAVIGARLLHRWPDLDLAMTRLRDVGAVVLLAGVASATVAATLGTLALAQGDVGDPRFGARWVSWWTGDLVGIVCITPLLLAWLRGGALPRDWRWWLQLGACVALAGAIAAGVFLRPQPYLNSWLLLPALVWAALQFEVRGAALAATVVGALSLAGPELTDTLLLRADAAPLFRFLVVQQFLLVICGSTLVLAVVAGERRQERRLRAQVEAREAAERAAHESAERLDLVARATGVVIFEYDVAAGRVVRSANAVEVLDRPVTSVGAVDDHAAWLHPDDRARAAATFAGLSPSSPRYAFEGRFERGDGRYIWFEERGLGSFDANGRLVRIVGVMLDATERVRIGAALARSEERLRLAQEAGGIGTWDWDIANGRSTWSDDVRRLHAPQLRPGEESVEAWRESIHPDDRARVLAAAERSYVDGHFAAEYRVLWPDGTVRWVESHADGRRDADGRMVRMVGIARDITDRRRVEAERDQLLEAERAARESADRANRLKDEFLAALSHELRTPLNAIMGWVHLLERRSEEPSVREAAAVIRRNAQAQVQIVEDLLDMSRIVAGKLRLHPEPMDLGALLADAVASIAPAADAKRVVLRLTTDASVEPIVADPQRLRQVFWNLLTNALKFTPPDGRVDVRLERRGARLRVQVVDSGAGIRPEFLPHVFERFRQADGGPAREHRGLGLGLAIVRQLVELHGGSVRADSDGPGRGATFTVELPAVDASPAQQHLAFEELAPAAHDLLRGLCVLVVEDEADARSALVRLLEEQGAEVVACDCAAAALATLERVRADAIVSDLGMPGMDGYEFARRLRLRPPKAGGLTPALALTAFARPEDEERALAAGFQAHLAKPADPARLARAIARLTTPVESRGAGVG